MSLKPNIWAGGNIEAERMDRGLIYWWMNGWRDDEFKCEILTEILYCPFVLKP